MMMEFTLFIMLRMFVMGGLKTIEFPIGAHLGVFALMFFLTEASNGAFIKDCGKPLMLLQSRTTARLAEDYFYPY
jgi:hypothetical protein